MTLPCRIYKKNVNGNYDAIQCDIGNFFFFFKYNNLNYMDYEYLQQNNDPWTVFLAQF